MTRIKKSRKPGTTGGGSKEKNISDIGTKRSARKPKGKKPGSRQNIDKSTVQSSPVNKSQDPRHGSKKPIALGKVDDKKPTQKVSKPKSNKPAIAPINIIEPEIANNEKLAEELAAIEADQVLIALMEKQDADQALTEEEFAYVEKNLDRHDELTAILNPNGDSEGSSEHDSDISDLSDDQLWDKFDNSDFTEFENDK